MRKLLFPFCLLFRIIVFIRNKMYDHELFKIIRLSAKVISIGNITSGGAGKTPFAEMISSYIIGKGKFAVIVIKGYMREADDMKVAELGYKNEDAKLNSENFSDEGMLLLQNLQNVDKKNLNGRGIIVVGDDKSRAVKFADSKFQPNIIIIDDGFQHRKIHRDMDIVIINNKKDWMIPAGNMREPYKNITRADLIVTNNKFENRSFTPGTKHTPRIECNYILEDFINIKNEKLDITGKKTVAFSGIGDPESFKVLLDVNLFKISSYIVFPDHHFFKKEDVQKIINEYNSSKSDCITTTQKDFVRLKDSRKSRNQDKNNIFMELLLNYPIYYAKIKMQISQNEHVLYQKIDELLN